jgi:hypothetical protein
MSMSMSTGAAFVIPHHTTQHRIARTARHVRRAPSIKAVARGPKRQAEAPIDSLSATMARSRD